MNQNAGSIFIGDLPAVFTSDALRDRRELASVAFERARMPMVITDPRQPDNPIIMTNHAFLDLTGYGAGEVIGRNFRFLQGPQTSSTDVDRIRDSLSTSSEVSIELLNY